MMPVVAARASMALIWATMAKAVVSIIDFNVGGVSMIGNSPVRVLGPGVGIGRGCKGRKHLQQDRRKSGKIGVRRHGRIRNYTMRPMIIRATMYETKESDYNAMYQKSVGFAFGIRCPRT